MRLSKIGAMNIVSDACSVRRILIRAVDRKMRSDAGGSLQHYGDKMSFGIVIFSNLASWISACGIEGIKLLGRILPLTGLCRRERQCSPPRRL